MKLFSIIALAALATSVTLASAEPVTPPAKSVPTVAVSAPQKTAATSQQDKMRDCNKQATGKKGAERKTFMKTCLSKKA